MQPPCRFSEARNTIQEEAALWVPTQRKLLAQVLLTLCAWTLIGISVWAGWQRFCAHRTVHPIRSLAVLPLRNFSGDPEQDYFADGMTEELITELSRIPSLEVISRTSVMSYRDTKKRLPQIARELGVDGIVEGSICKEGDKVRVTVQLLDGLNDRHIWSEDYQRELSGILILQGEIARAISQQIRAQVTPQQPTQQDAISSAKPRSP